MDGSGHLHYSSTGNSTTIIPIEHLDNVSAMVSPESLLELKRIFTEHPLFLLGLLLLIGYAVGKLALRIRLPEITGFIVAGLMVSPYTTGVVQLEMNPMLHVVTEVAIGFLALTIGAEFSRTKLRRIGRTVLSITLISLTGTILLVWLGCLALNAAFQNVNIGHPYALLLAVIACATSPAIIVAEIHHMRAHGRFVDYLFGVVALTDAITVVVFGLAFTVIINVLGAVGSYSIVGVSIREIGLSIGVGGLAALPLGLFLLRSKSRNEMMIITMGYVFVITGAAIALHLSPLLTNMAMGAVVAQFPMGSQRVFRALEPLTPPLYALFFIIAGIEIDPRIFAAGPVLLVGLGYIVLRDLSKYGMVWMGCRLSGVENTIGRNLGLCMFSKGGVALGFVLLIQTSPALEALRGKGVLYDEFTLLANIVLMSIFINELVSPIFLRYAVIRGNKMQL